jgi:hypothetical protein
VYKKKVASLKVLFVLFFLLCTMSVFAQEIYDSVDNYIGGNMFQPYKYELTLSIDSDNAVGSIDVPSSGTMTSMPHFYMGISTIKFMIQINSSWYIDIDFLQGTNNAKILIYDKNTAEDYDVMAIFELTPINSKKPLAFKAKNKMNFLSEKRGAVTLSDFSIAISR